MCSICESGIAQGYAVLAVAVNSNRLSVCELVYLDLWPRQGALVREKLWALKARVETIPYEDRVENVEEA